MNPFISINACTCMLCTCRYMQLPMMYCVSIMIQKSNWLLSDVSVYVYACMYVCCIACDVVIWIWEIRCDSCHLYQWNVCMYIHAIAFDLVCRHRISNIKCDSYHMYKYVYVCTYMYVRVNMSLPVMWFVQFQKSNVTFPHIAMWNVFMYMQVPVMQCVGRRTLEPLHTYIHVCIYTYI